MANRLTKIFRRKSDTSLPAVVEKSAYPLPSTGGAIPASWPWNWWQQGKSPVYSGETSVVHACVDAYGQTIASIPGYHWRYDDQGTKTKILTSSVARVLHTPNDYQTRSDVFLNAVKGLMLTGNAYIVGKRNDRNEINEIHLLPPKSTTPMIEPETKAVFYAAGLNPLLGEVQYLIPARDMCHIRLYTPYHPLIGVSPIKNAAASVAANAAITAHQAAFFDNMSRPSGVLSTDTKLTKDQMLQLRSAWEEQSKNLNSGGVPILGSGMKWSQMSMSSQDAQLVEAFNMTVEDVARAFRVPLPLVNDNRNSTYNNVEQLIAHWLSGGLGFVLDHVENNLSKFFGLGYKDFVEFNVESLLRTDFVGRVDGYSKAIQFGLLAPNEARSRFDGLAPVKHGDKPIVQQQMVPLGWTETNAANEPAPPPPDDELEQAAMVGYIKRVLDNG